MFFLSQVETVALWVGLVSGIASITLTIVAIVFTWVVATRADSLNTQMIKSLQKIETTVDRQSDDIKGLIRQAWEKMLDVPAAGDEAIEEPPAVSEEVTKGIVAEAQAELAESDSAGTPGSPDKVTFDREVIDRLFERLGALTEDNSRRGPRGYGRSPRDESMRRVLDLSPTALEVARRLAEPPTSLEARQYRRLSGSPLRGALAELRAKHVVVPLDAGPDERVVYGFPSETEAQIKLALALAPNSPRSTRRAVARELANVGIADTLDSPDDESAELAQP